MLQAYGLVPEAYQQKFRDQIKLPTRHMLNLRANSMPTPRSSNVPPVRKNKSPKLEHKNAPPAAGESRKCFYCHEPGHLIVVCPVLKRKGQSKTSKTPVGVGFIKTTTLPETLSEPVFEPESDAEIDPCFKPFISQGFVSLTGEEKDKVP